MVGISVPTSFYWILICTKDLLDGSSVLGVCKGIQKIPLIVKKTLIWLRFEIGNDILKIISIYLIKNKKYK